MVFLQEKGIEKIEYLVVSVCWDPQGEGRITAWDYPGEDRLTKQTVFKSSGGKFRLFLVGGPKSHSSCGQTQG